MTTETASAGDEGLLAEFERKISADLQEIEELKRLLAEKQSAFKARHLRVLAALER
jgi:hypothetical protein